MRRRNRTGTTTGEKLSRLSQIDAYTLTLMVDAGDHFRDLAPYVASIDSSGTVAFQATLNDGSTGVFISAGEQMITVADTVGSIFSHFYSHPDIGDDGSLCFYAGLKSGGQGVLRTSGGQVTAIATTGADSPFACIGPLGPTMNHAGQVAFRADLKSGESGVFIGDGQSVATIADSGGIFSAFHGLPVINNRGTVVFRADQRDGGQGVYTGDGGALTTVVNSNDGFSELGRFPIIDDGGIVAFVATFQAGGGGVFKVAKGEVAAVVDTQGPFEHFRGVLINNAGTTIFYATPGDGQLGVYAGPGPTFHRIIAMGQPLFGSTVADFALNPVSLNDAGQVAIRVKLADGRQFILRADPKPP